jgi:phosphatidylglycerol lysyltransferase
MAASGRTSGRVRSLLGGLFSLTVFVLAVWFLHHEFQHINWEAVLESGRAIAGGRLIEAALCAAAGYLALTGFDTLAVRFAGRSLPYRRTALTAFMAYAVGHNVGVAAVSGGAIRYRVYSTLGLSAIDISIVVVFCTTTFVLGSSLLLGSALWTMAPAQLALLKLPPPVLYTIGAGLLAVPITYLAWCAAQQPRLRLGGWSAAPPRLTIALGQVGLAIADLSFAAATLYVLLPASLGLGFPSFLGIYLLAISAGLISSVPGGIGVFEAALVLLLPDMNAEALIATILVYRLIYYIAPLSLATVLLAGHEVLEHRERIGRVGGVALNWLSRVAPQVMAVVVFLGGVVLIVSGAIPAVESRLALMKHLIPLPVLEISHLTGSVVGLGLMLLARALLRRLVRAYQITLVVLMAGIVASLLKGLDYEEASILAVIALLLYASRDAFYRAGSVAGRALPGRYLVNVLLVLIGSVWIALLSQHHLEYSNQLWWQFSLNADAPRMLRATLVVLIALAGVGLWRLLNAERLGDAVPTQADMDAVRRILPSATDSSANVALLGDKRFLFNERRDAFLMYQVRGRSWICLGDPIGEESSAAELAWKFRELSDSFNGRTVFYQVTDRMLPTYIDMGLALLKLGEDAVVSLADFSLEGPDRAELRHAHSRGRRAGATFEIIPRQRIGEAEPALKAVSDEWLASKATAEKGFSLGRYTADYIANFDCAVVTVAGHMVAFANLWQAPAGGELSIDLMRYGAAAPKGVMDFLFIELMLWGKAQGFTRFSLGMAPLAGLEQRALAPLWHKIGNVIFRWGEDLYHFEGLRRFKEKFNPDWRPRYLVCRGGRQIPVALMDTTALISGGLEQIWTKERTQPEPGRSSS